MLLLLLACCLSPDTPERHTQPSSSQGQALTFDIKRPRVKGFPTQLTIEGNKQDPTNLMLWVTMYLIVKVWIFFLLNQAHQLFKITDTFKCLVMSNISLFKVTLDTVVEKYV